MTQLHSAPRPAATLVLVRDSPEGIEVFMMQRTHQAAFIPGGYVFPGGAVDPSDSDKSFEAHCTGLDDGSASQLLNLETGGLAYWVAAIRECFEESGLLLAYDKSGRFPNTDADVQLSGLRAELADGKMTLAEFCDSRELRLALDKLVYFGHWITPAGAPRRYDTRFFVAVAPDRQTAAHDNCETIGHAWIRPSEALERGRAGEMTIMFATVKTLELLARFDSTDALMTDARALKSIAARLPRVSTARSGRRVLIQGDHAYAEVGKLDPTGKGDVSCEILPGVATHLSDKIRRITAPNPGFMTGPGTNSYLVGTGDEIAVIDPGPADNAHVDRLLELAKGRIRWVLTTHTHLDHSPAALLLKARTGAQLLGMPAPHFDRQDLGFQPDIVLKHGQQISLAGCALRVIHTPGHASNHLCYLLEDERLLFTGDHIMQGSTVVINPPDGDMAAYMRSLLELKELNIDYLAPGHGFLMDKPHDVIDRLVAHRLKREQKIAAALSRLGSASVEDLLTMAYDDVPEHRHPMASRSLLAHLIKLKSDGQATELNGKWKMLDHARHESTS
jgi:glyoxylase-like metal-dependent hydrolase (beta-lactamase superfamily II)